MNDIISQIINFIASLFKGAGSTASPTAVPAPTPAKTPPKLEPQNYTSKLVAEVVNPRYANVPDDPTTAANERKTFCNYFTRAVCGWFGWTNFESPDRDQAGEITRYMRSHPDTWYKLEAEVTYTDSITKQKMTKTGADFDSAAKYANQGCLIVAGQENPLAGQPGQSTGHVCVLMPGLALHSTKWGRPVPMCANVGGNNFVNKALSHAFKEEPELFLFMGA